VGTKGWTTLKFRAPNEVNITKESKFWCGHIPTPLIKKNKNHEARVYKKKNHNIYYCGFPLLVTLLLGKPLLSFIYEYAPLPHCMSASIFLMK